MKKIFLMFAAILLVVSVMATPSSAYLLNWGFDPTGGGDSILEVPEYLDLTGTASIENDYDNFTFTETGTFRSFSYGPGALDLVPRLSATFTATGTLTPGEFFFDNVQSSLNIYDGADNLIGVFDLLSGGGELNADFGPSNGFITANFVARSLAAGYWFTDATGSMDLSLYTIDEMSPMLTLGFATTNATVVSGTEVLDGEGRLLSFDVGNNGQFRLAVVPEPGTMFLLGTGLVGFAIITRRKFLKK